MHPIYFAVDLLGKIIAALRGRYFFMVTCRGKAPPSANADRSVA